MLEKQDNLAYNQNNKFINETYARDYTTRFPYTLGGNFGIYLSGTTQTPVQEGNSGTTITDTGSLTLITSNTGASSGGTFTCGIDTVSAGGYTYNTVFLDGKCWTLGNMKHGTLLTNGNTLPSDINIIEKWCPMISGTRGSVTISASKCETYGGLYTRYEAMGLSDTQTTINTEDTTKSVCGQLGSGWYLPNDTDYTNLIIAGATGRTGNKFLGLISSLPGYRNTDVNFFYLGSKGYWWPRSDTSYYGRILSTGNATLSTNVNPNKLYGYYF